MAGAECLDGPTTAAGPSTPASRPFSLRKWYLDCVSPDGRSAIAYWAAASLGRWQVAAVNIAAHEPGRAPSFWGRVVRVPPPALDDGRLVWRVPRIGFAAVARLSRPPFGCTLVDDARGVATWECVASDAQMSLDLPDGRTLEGAGYAECLAFDFPPWALRIRELRWGHWTSAAGDRSLVWLDWRGGDSLTAVFIDGVRRPVGVVSDDEVRASPDVDLRLDLRATLHARTLGSVVGRSLGALRLLPRAWLTLEDRKWLSRGMLRGSGSPDASGWAVHECVRFP